MLPRQIAERLIFPLIKPDRLTPSSFDIEATGSAGPPTRREQAVERGGWCGSRSDVMMHVAEVGG